MADIDLDFSILKPEYIDAAVNNKLDGQTFSDRIWQNKANMIDKLQGSILDAMQGNTTIDKVGKDIQQTFNVGAYESQRLATTEITRVQAQASQDIATNTGLTKHMWSATLDTHTCEECADLDGKIFDIDDDSSPEMPLHPLDRCCWINVPFDSWQPSVRKDNETKEIIDYKDYEQWLKDKGDNGLNNKNSKLSMPEITISHSNVGEFSNPKNPKKQVIGKFKSGGHGQENINILQNNNIEYNVVKEYSNGVRIGNVPSHKMSSKRTGTGQAWFPEEWTQNDIEKAGQYVSNLKDKSQYILEPKYVNGQLIAIFKYANYDNVTVGICYDVKKKKVTTIFPDETQRMLGGE